MHFGFLVLLDFGFGGVSSGLLDSAKLPAAPDGDSWGGGVPMDLVHLHGTGDPHGDSRSYTKSLLDSSHSVGVGSCLKHLLTLGFVSQNVPPPRYTKTIFNGCISSGKPNCVFGNDSNVFLAKSGNEVNGKLTALLPGWLICSK